MRSQDTPRALFPGRRLGCFDPGCEASFLLLGGDPLADLNQVDMPLLRVKQGRLLTRLADVAASSSQATASTADAPKKPAPKAKGKTKAKSTGKSAAASSKTKATAKAKAR